jgi:hypothetical protein
MYHQGDRSGRAGSALRPDPSSEEIELKGVEQGCAPELTLGQRIMGNDKNSSSVTNFASGEALTTSGWSWTSCSERDATNRRQKFPLDVTVFGAIGVGLKSEIVCSSKGEKVDSGEMWKWCYLAV